MSRWAMRLGTVLRRAREKAKLTQAELADMLLVCRSTVQRAEAGEITLNAHLVDCWEFACRVQLEVAYHGAQHG